MTGGCDRNPCFAKVSCTNVGMRGSSFQCGDCPNGYTGDGITCTDVNEVIKIILTTFWSVPRSPKPYDKGVPGAGEGDISSKIKVFLVYMLFVV